MLCVTGLCEGNSPVTGEFPTQRASNAENVFFWWRHHLACYGYAMATQKFVNIGSLVVFSSPYITYTNYDWLQIVP